MSTKAKILIITGDAGESYECLYAKHRFEEAGYQSVIAAPSKKRMNLVIHDFEPGWDTYIEKPGYLVESDIAFSEVNTQDYLAVLLLGGRAPEFLRHDAKVLDIVREFDRDGKYIFSICHGIQILTAAGLVKGKTLTCYENVRFEVESCGGTFVGKSEAVKDGRYVTGQTWQSHPDFYRLVFECLQG
ncbi:DJ-1/PfpI family protein [Haliscomenobacter sp.]|jgi:protease I|uniref:DJ-1/PfpI family protein n=1 Tax=Haliscomenobacter sp. TaxID=2717303 RepID=UPI003BA85969